MLETLLKIWIKNKLILSIWLVTASLSGITLFLSPKNPLLLLVCSVNRPSLSKILLLLILLSSGLISSLVILYIYNSKFKQYSFSIDAGSWIHKTDATKRICAACRVDNVFSPLYLDSVTSCFICPKCDNKSKNIPIVIIKGNITMTIEEVT